MIVLKTNANSIANKLCYEDSVIAFFYSVCENYAKGYVQPFITNMQILITKLGIIVSKISTKSIRISYCGQSITYLCKTVLNKPHLENTFDDVGLNDKGNKGKHSIENNRIDMDKAVATYNNLVNLIIAKYHLTSLKALVVTKRYPKAENQSSDHPHTNTKPGNQIKPKKKQRVEHATTTDERLKLTAELVRGDGFYNKGLFHKRKMLNFILKISIKNPDHLKIKSIVAFFKSSRNVQKMKITKAETVVDLDASLFSGNITASVVIVYKIGLLKTKQIKTSVTKQF